ncbi:MAG: flavodoxin-dependent (E)-4-hydroxy-3-methylbut-2-enyl-diphosphate synthase, partial [Fibrobacterales bacterium]|nr:flavodoxin-dependent (E)-4-hydroxy-3-methylbut-2-enyl-diphosphate synthase [Fibrobacterales bacterium]
RAKLPAGDAGRMSGGARIGSLLVDGIGDLVCVDAAGDAAASAKLGFDLLQASGRRRTRTEYISCPSCGRTLYDLVSVTEKIKARTSHLADVAIGIMGCIVNGPGEMADADFGYVGGAPGKIDLYVKRECVKKGIPSDQAVEALVDLIKAHGRWKDPA